MSATASGSSNGALALSSQRRRWQAIFLTAAGLRGGDTAGPTRAREKFSMAYAVINDDAPAIWLYEPRKIIGIHRRIRTTVMRPDAWWSGLADWSIPPTERILRDRLPVRR